MEQNKSLWFEGMAIPLPVFKCAHCEDAYDSNEMRGFKDGFFLCERCYEDLIDNEADLPPWSDAPLLSDVLTRMKGKPRDDYMDAVDVERETLGE